MAVWAYERIYGAFPWPCLAASFIRLQFPSLARQFRISGGSTDDEKQMEQLRAKNFRPAFEIALDKTALHQGRASATSMAWAMRQVVLFVEGKPSQVDAEAVRTKIAEWTEWATGEDREALLESALVSAYEESESSDKTDSDHEPDSED